jgi:hypothetical protein
MEIKGFEAIRSDWSPISQAAQKKVLEILLTAPEMPYEKRYNEMNRPRRCHNEPEFNLAEEFLLQFGKNIYNLPFEQLKPHVITYSPIKRHPSQYKSMPPGVAAFMDYCEREALNPATEWLVYDKFPWIIIPGEGPVFKRARHPDYVHEIDRFFYVRQMLLGIRTFGLETEPEDVLAAQNVSLEEFVSDDPSSELEIMAYTSADLTWKSKKEKPKKKKQVPAGQSLLSMFIIEEE